MGSQFVNVYGNKIEVEKDITLNLSKMNIKDISDIKGLESLDSLQSLNLNNNQITEIKGLKSLDNLQSLALYSNQIPEDLINELGTDAKKYIDYCRKEAKRLENIKKD